MITITVHEAKNLKEKTTGLIGKKEPHPLLLRTRFGIHTFGLLYPIDVVILNSKHIIVKQKKSLQPNRLFFWNPLFDLVIELPVGFLSEKQIKLYDALHLIMK